MPVKLKPADEDFIPEVPRRFLFDDAAVQEQQQASKSGVATAAKELFKSEQASLYNFMFSLYPSLYHDIQIMHRIV